MTMASEDNKTTSEDTMATEDNNAAEENPPAENNQEAAAENKQDQAEEQKEEDAEKKKSEEETKEEEKKEEEEEKKEEDTKEAEVAVAADESKTEEKKEEEAEKEEEKKEEEPVNSMYKYDQDAFEDESKYSWKCLFRIDSMHYTCPTEKDKKMLLYLNVIKDEEIFHSEPKIGVVPADKSGVFVWNKQTCSKKGKRLKLPLAFYVEMDKDYSLKMKIKKKGGNPIVFSSYTDIHVFTMDINNVINKQFAKRKEHDGKQVVMALQTNLKGDRLFTLNCTIIRFDRMDANLKMESVSDFTTCNFDSVSDWGGVTTDHLAEADLKQYPEIRVSEQRFMNKENDDDAKPLFTSKIYHSLPLRFAAIHVMQNDTIVASSHLIDLDQLSKLEYSLDSATMREGGGRAMLIRNRYGDFSVLSAHWEGFIKKTKKEKGEPGFLQMDYSEIKNKKTVHNLGFFTQGGKTRYVSISGMRLNLDVENGEVVIHGSSEDTPEKVALALSVLTLLVLCEPRTDVNITSIKYGYSSDKYQPTEGQKTKFNYYEIGPWDNHYLRYCGYNEETCSNSHLFVAAPLKGKPLSKWVLSGEEENTQEAEEEPSCYWNTANEDEGEKKETFCPWISDQDPMSEPEQKEEPENKEAEMEAAAAAAAKSDEEEKKREEEEKKEEEAEEEKKDDEKKEEEKDEEKKEDEDKDEPQVEEVKVEEEKKTDDDKTAEKEDQDESKDESRNETKDDTADTSTEAADTSLDATKEE